MLMKQRFLACCTARTHSQHHRSFKRTNVGETRFAGVAALFAGTAWVAWAALNTRTHGGLDVGAIAVGERMSRVGALLMVGWNLLLIPATLVLYATLVELHPYRVRLATTC